MMRERPQIILGGTEGKKKRPGGIRQRIYRLLLVSAVVVFVVLSMQSMTRASRVRQAQLDIARIGHAARLFRADFGRCPSGLQELVSPPEGTSYIAAGSDPWGNPYEVVCPSSQSDSDVEVYSLGPDGMPAGKDNIATVVLRETP